MILGGMCRFNRNASEVWVLLAESLERCSSNVLADVPRSLAANSPVTTQEKTTLGICKSSKM